MNPTILTLVILFSSLIFIFLVLYLVLEISFRKLFSKRGDGHPSIRYYLFQEFPLLEREKMSFMSKGCLLHGYIYKNKNIKNYKALIVMVHGIGFGHSYLFPLINFFTKNGYLILAYDQTASGISEGRRIKGFTSALIDIENALEFIKSDQNLQNYPLYLFGHSWGGYAVINALNFDKFCIKKVISVSGFNSEIDFYISVKPFLRYLKPILFLYEYLHYGKYVKFNAYDALIKTNADVLFLQGKDDITVPLSISGDLFNKINNPHVEVKLLDNKGHTPFVDEHSQKMQNEVMSQYGFLGGVDIPLDKGVDYRKISIPDENVYKMMLDFYNK